MTDTPQAGQDEVLQDLLSANQRIISDAENKAQTLSRNFLRHSRWVFGITIASFIVLALIAILLLCTGVYLAMAKIGGLFIHFFTAFVFLSGVVILLTLAFKNPISLTSGYLARMAKIEVIFIGFSHQVGKVNSYFQKLLITADHPTEKELKLLLKELQTMINEALDSLTLALNEME